MRTEAPRPVRLADYRPPPYLIDTVMLDVRLAPQNTRVTSGLSVRRNPAVGASADPLVLDGEGIELVSLSLDGQALAGDAFTVDDERLVIARPPTTPFTLVVETACNPDTNTGLSGLYRSNGVYCTQCEAEGFRRITYYIDRPDVLARFTTRIEARRSDAPILLSNGNLVEQGDIPGTERHYAVWHDPFPKPSYLFALVGGELACVEDTFVTMSGRNVALRIYVEPGKEDRCGYAMDALKRAMAWDEQRYGREYDLDVFMIVAVSDFNMGAMENKGLNIFNDKYILARPDTATDVDYANIEAIIAHEYFHNWTGNRITCRDWFQLCLKEGLTVFRDQEFSSDMRSRPVKRIADVRLLRSHQFPEDAGPLAHPVRPSSYIEINNFYTATVYEKGAEIVRMLHIMLGEEVFRSAMDLYFDRHDGEAATIEDFLKCMEDASGRDLNRFRLWYSQAGTPQLAVSGRYVEPEGVYEMTVAQSTPPTPGQSRKSPLHIPLAVGLVGPDGRDMPLVLEGGRALNGQIVEITRRETTLRFTGIDARPVLSLNRNFSAPVKLAANISEDDLLFLVTHDSDPFNRWEACQKYATDLLVRAIGGRGAMTVANSGKRLADALRICLDDPSLDQAFLAQLLTLPSETDLAAQIEENVDPEAIHVARESLKAELGQALAPVLGALYEQLAHDGPYSPDAASAGRRALRLAALNLLAAADAESGTALAFGHFREASNMTDTVGALSVLAILDRPERTEALQKFYHRHHDDPLVVDKWLALSAMLPVPEKIDEIVALTSHRAFSLEKPNKVRALIGTFASANPVCFNEPAGRGYQFVADTVIRLDPLNPQVAARLAAAFKSWRSLEPARREQARLALERIKTQDALSRDTSEIVAKTLA